MPGRKCNFGRAPYTESFRRCSDKADGLTLVSAFDYIGHGRVRSDLRAAAKWRFACSVWACNARLLVRKCAAAPRETRRAGRGAQRWTRA
eukprot:1263711-Pleurochrysis_carterae.AAC.2